jgi:hypothetical protein
VRDGQKSNMDAAGRETSGSLEPAAAFNRKSVPSSQDFKRTAQECRTLASRCVDPMERAMLRGIAEQWERLAHRRGQKEAQAW